MSDVLQHYGIRGMKWGVRRFQQKDGSLTSQGRKRYGGEDGPERKKLPAAGKAAVGAAAAAGIVLTAYLVKRHGAKKAAELAAKAEQGKRAVEQLGSTRAGAMVVDVLEPLVLVSVLAVSTGYLVDGSFNPFLYFRF